MKNMVTGAAGYAFLASLFLMSVVCFLFLNVYDRTIYPAIGFSFLFVFQLFSIIRYSDLERSLKKNICVVAGLLITVIVSNVLWVFVFSWFKYIASVSAFIFVLLLFLKLRSGMIKNE